MSSDALDTFGESEPEKSASTPYPLVDAPQNRGPRPTGRHLLTPAHRLPAAEIKRRRARFLMLVAEGHEPETAREQAELSLKEAFKVTSERDFWAIVEAVRETGETLAVTVELLDTRKEAA
jgi:hypothetical protein